VSDTGGKNSVLIVDDTPENIDLLGGVLDREYKIKVALNGEKALNIAGSADPPDIILLDIMMPGMDGYEVCRRLKADPDTQDIPVIFITAKSDESDETKGLETGAVDYITKPFSPPIVLARLKTHLALKNVLNELYLKNHMLNARANELTSINRLAEKTSSSLNMNEILQVVCDELVTIFVVRNAGIGLFDKARTKLTIAAFRSSDPQEEDATGMELPLRDFEATQIVIQTKQPIAIENAQIDPRTKPIHSLMQDRGTVGLLIVPILSLNEVIGTIEMPAKHTGQAFTRQEIELAKIIASQVASSIENARLYARVEHALDIAEQDLEIGRQTQVGFLPRTLPKIPQWEIVPYFVAARQVAGDFYDAFEIGKRGRTGLVVADVCDKGVGAALFMVVFRSLIRAFSEDRKSSDSSENLLLRIVSTVNNYIATVHDRSNMFATVFFGVLEPERNTLFYVNAGHELPLVTDAQGNIKQVLETTGPAIGMMPDMDFTVGAVELQAGDILVAYTDGVVDVRNLAGEPFSEERLLSCIKKPYSSAFSLLNCIEHKISDHMSKTNQFDDITMLALRRKESVDHEKHEIALSAVMKNLRPIKQFVEQAAGHMGLDENAIFALKLVVEEACTNIINHGYSGADPGPIKLTLEMDLKKVTLTIYDEGVFFNPENMEEADVESDWEERRVGGMGLHIIRELVDEVGYERSETGNLMILVKHINS
jgi:sigma-B regulation protein RsbU (phosphoserine phosphatase)